MKFPGPLWLYPILLPAWITTSVIKGPYTQKRLQGMICIWNDATWSQPSVKAFCMIYLGCLCTFILWGNSLVSFLRNFTLKCLSLLLKIWKLFFFAISHFRRILIGALTYVVLKTVSSLMADFNVVSNPDFFILFCTSSHTGTFFAKISLNVSFFTYLALLDLKLKHHLMRKFLSWGLDNMSIVRRCEFLWCTEAELLVFF